MCGLDNDIFGEAVAVFICATGDLSKVKYEMTISFLIIVMH